MTTIDTGGQMKTRGTVKKAGREKGVLHAVWVGVCAGLFGLVALLALAIVIVPVATNSTPMTVLTQSMEPTLPPGTFIVVKPTPIDEIAIGDAMTYQIRSGEPEVVTHRVVGISMATDGERTFITQGDNNSTADEKPVVGAQVRGVVWYSIPWIGYFAIAIHGENRSWIIPVAAIALAGYAAYMLISAGIGATKKRRGRRNVEIGTDHELSEADETNEPAEARQ